MPLPQLQSSNDAIEKQSHSPGEESVALEISELTEDARLHFLYKILKAPMKAHQTPKFLIATTSMSSELVLTGFHHRRPPGGFHRRTSSALPEHVIAS